MNTFKLIGIMGLVLICLGMVVKNRKTRDTLSFFGGVGLLIYSIYLKDIIFIILQAIYIIVVTVDYFKQKN
jgi:lipid-A-disaccharide synthase-like uncharacterized protein